jgi:hypothetical protein
MRTSYLAMGVAGFLAIAVAADWYFRPGPAPALPPVGPISLDCGRTCLEGLVDDYLSALVENDPAALPLSEDVRFTENNQRLAVGDGFWLTAARRGTYGHYFADPPMGHAAFIGTIEEAGRDVFLGLRLRVELGRITEIESVVFRDSEESGMTPDVAEGVWFETTPPSERPSRPQLIAVANAYFEAIESGNSRELYRFAADCVRIENGISEPCADQFESGYSLLVTRVHGRRFPLVDEERGVVWAYSVFDHDGTAVRRGAPPEVETESMAGLPRPSSVQIAAAVLIDAGLIRRIEVVRSAVPYHSGSPWEGGLSGR